MAQSFIVVAHNQKAHNHTQLLRIKLPKNNYKAEVWDKHEKKFVGSHDFDILEQIHFQKEDQTFTDYEMFIDHDLEANEVGFIRVSKTDGKQSLAALANTTSKTLLEISGFTEDNEALFKFTNKEQEFQQSFGVTLKYWKAKQVKNDKDGGPEGFAEGAYIMAPVGWHSEKYSKIDPDITYEQGKTVEQWTIKFADKSTQQYAVLKVRYSPSFNELIEFDVELSPVPVDNDKQGKDVTVNWRMYDGFEANKTFWTDSNGLEMQERRINWRPTFTVDAKQNISSNFYPVASAVAMRDFSKNSGRAVVVVNDRTQAGSAEIHKSTIELVQNRRLIQDDIRGVEEPLNEVDKDNNGLKVNARYYMHIFDRTKAQSRQREAEINVNQPV